MSQNCLIAIEGTTNETRVGDVVFVHGLDGDAYGTWQQANDPDFYWPRWLGEDLPTLGVWSASYEAGYTVWKSRAMPIFDQASNLLALLQSKVGGRPIVFITHSLGGLIVKQMLRLAIDSGDEKFRQIADMTCGVVFIATPNTGATAATWIDRIRLFFRPTHVITEIKRNAPALRDLAQWYSNTSEGPQLSIRSQVYFETKPYFGTLVVDETSSNIGIPGVIPIAIDANHIDISKPLSRDAALYGRVRTFIEELLQGSVQSKNATKDAKLAELIARSRARCIDRWVALGVDTKLARELAVSIAVGESDALTAKLTSFP